MKRLMIQRNRMIKERKYCGDNICHSIILGNTIFIFIVEKNIYSTFIDLLKDTQRARNKTDEKFLFQRDN